MWAGGGQAAQKLTERERFMRVGRLAAAGGVFAPALTPAPAPATTPGPGPTPAPSKGPQATIIVRPGVLRMTQTAQAAPPTTAQCEQDFNVACYGPAQV